MESATAREARWTRTVTVPAEVSTAWILPTQVKWSTGCHHGRATGQADAGAHHDEHGDGDQGHDQKLPHRVPPREYGGDRSCRSPQQRRGAAQPNAGAVIARPCGDLGPGRC